MKTTIAAIATAPGNGGIGIVRLSGPQAFAIAEQLSGQKLALRTAQYAHFWDEQGQLIDSGLQIAFAGPKSFTGEDVVELQGHGGQVVMAALLQRVLDLGAIAAKPGEFSERAFHNGKLDLAQAEAIADLIAAGSEQAMRAAQRSLSGVFSEQCAALHQLLLNLRMHLESAIDFPEEEIDFLSDPILIERWQSLHVEHSKLLQKAEQGALLSEGLNVVLVGAPNAGKSSLLNALAQRESAIVTDIPGTTRDLLKENILLNGVPVHITDTAGLRETDDPVEQEGLRRAQAALLEADLILLLQAEDAELPQWDLPDLPTIHLHNKCDRQGLAAAWLDEEQKNLRMSAKTGEGVELLAQAISGRSQNEAGDFSARRRHVDALKRCGHQLKQAGEYFEHGHGELAAEALRLALQDLGEITGQVHSDDLLGEIFSSFCIGK